MTEQEPISASHNLESKSRTRLDPAPLFEATHSSIWFKITAVQDSSSSAPIMKAARDMRGESLASCRRSLPKGRLRGSHQTTMMRVQRQGTMAQREKARQKKFPWVHASVTDVMKTTRTRSSGQTRFFMGLPFCLPGPFTHPSPRTRIRGSPGSISSSKALST
jgi:hypothetical protein